jgi:hypothetical protein
MRSALARWVIAAVFSLGTASMSTASTLGLDITSKTGVALPGAFDNAGWQFTVNAPVTVDGLGFFDVNANGLSQSHQVGLWDNNGTLLAQATVSSASTPVTSASAAGDWLFESIAPLVLQPGTYVTSVYFPSPASDALMLDATITTDPRITVVGARLSINGQFAEPALLGPVELAVYGANIRLQTPAAVPEPASLLLVGFGLTMVVWRARNASWRREWDSL